MSMINYNQFIIYCALFQLTFFINYYNIIVAIFTKCEFI